MPAFASGTDPAPEPLPEIIEEEPTTGGMEPEGVPITPKGNATLVDDFYGDKQLITVTTKAGNYYYILMQKRSMVYGSSGSAFTTTAWAPLRFQAHFLCRHLMCR